ncbi:MAG: N-acetylmuramoyl-L-alanine amidase [Pseudomonadaceae bacterium]|jgi:N-acetylmuramoyl-L-alanine amidase|uniref:N-acetylmuramoyl-L-alanine amidase n=1 Tax=Pseudomonas TaxID=286 RepID=UPI000854A704|nr:MULTISPECIES: N-acetylmuramoyl-L-alanine amidase [Pseudomonas]MBQ55024.1 N-acetylmuramoyl-L-alanine amidase [Pseudomonadaceae bacterium]OEO24921.1 N-acetylmuramoyl-L-alanine amidase [Pseudomonas sp. J237]HCP55233.1 N-acetylmuramoyl-L-alanine amidase [Pseudomonas sp.]
MRFFVFALFFAVLAGCSSGPSIDTSYTATGQGSRVQYIVLHYTAADLPRSLQLLTQTDVSANYLIGDSPATIYRLVDENRRAWHVGVSEWQGRTWLNSTTIGIELVNQGYRDTPNGRQWVPFKEEQIDTLIVLLKDIMQRHNLKPGSIIGHSDAAPQRKVDPGPLFPWKRLADAGLVPWPDANRVLLTQRQMAGQVPSASWFQQQLKRQGYTVEQTGELDKATRNVIAAFQMKYRQARYDGEPDTETAAILLVLNSMR